MDRLLRSLDPGNPARIRVAVAGGLELRAASDDEGGPPAIAGHGALFNEETELWPNFREVIRPGAFQKTLSDGADVRGLFNHDPNVILGRTKSGTLELSEDKRGLAYVIDTPDTPTVRDLVVSPMERGDLDGSSFQFRAVKERFTRVGDDPDDPESYELREILEAQLFDVSPVTFPAYPDADSGLRAADQLRSAMALERATPDVCVRILRQADLPMPELLRAMLDAGGLTPPEARTILDSIAVAEPQCGSHRVGILERELQLRELI